MSDQDVTAALEKAQLALLRKIAESAPTLGASHRVLHMANAYALLAGTTNPASAYVDTDLASV